MRAILADGQREDRAIAFLMAACFVIFIGQWPRLSRQAHEDPSVPLEALLGATLLGWVFLMPLFFYALAAVTHMIVRAMGASAPAWTSRMALFWTLLVVAPLMLFQGLVAGLIGPGAQLMAAYTIVTVAFFFHWFLCLYEVFQTQTAT